MRNARPVARVPRVAAVRSRTAGCADVAQGRRARDRGHSSLRRSRGVAGCREPLECDDSARRALRGARVLDHREGGMPVAVDRDHDRTTRLPTDAQPLGRGSLRRRIERRIGGGSCGGGRCRRPWLGRDRLVALPGRVVRPRHPEPDERTHPQRRSGRSATERRVARLRAGSPSGRPHDGVRSARGREGRPFRRSAEGRHPRPRSGDGVHGRRLVRRRHASSRSTARVARPPRRARLADGARPSLERRVRSSRDGSRQRPGRR